MTNSIIKIQQIKKRLQKHTISDVKALEDLITVLQELSNYNDEERLFYIKELKKLTFVKDKQNRLEKDLKYLANENDKMLAALNLI